jgi:hypothetical protein
MKRREFITGLVGTAASPLVAHTQQPSMPVVGFMSARGPVNSEYLVTAFHRGLNDGVMTATFGGILRDLLGAESPIVLSREIYVTAALAGAASFVAAASRGRRRRGSAHRFWIARRRHSARLGIATLQVTP